MHSLNDKIRCHETQGRSQALPKRGCRELTCSRDTRLTDCLMQASGGAFNAMQRGPIKVVFTQNGDQIEPVIVSSESIDQRELSDRLPQVTSKSLLIWSACPFNQRIGSCTDPNYLMRMLSLANWCMGIPVIKMTGKEGQDVLRSFFPSAKVSKCWRVCSLAENSHSDPIQALLRS